MQTFRKSKSSLLSGLLLLALIMCYLHPKGHFLTEHISAPIVGLDTKEFASLPSGGGRKYKQNLVPKQGMGLASKEFAPLHQLSMAWENCLLSSSLPLGFFMTLCKTLLP